MMMARSRRCRCASYLRNSDDPSSVQIRKCPTPPRKYSFVFSKQLRSDCPHDRGVNSRILASSFALVLADIRTATRLLLWSLKRKPRKWTFPGVVTELFSSLISIRNFVSKNPGVARKTLRAAEGSPQHLRLPVWCVTGGAVFAQANSKDWTLRGFLSSKPASGGLGLDVAQDDPTRDALATAAPKLFEMPLSEL